MLVVELLVVRILLLFSEVQCVLARESEGGDIGRQARDEENADSEPTRLLVSVQEYRFFGFY